MPAQMRDIVFSNMEFVCNTRTARVERLANGIVVTRILPLISQTVQDAVENVSASAKAASGKKTPLIVDLRHALPLDAATRHYYTGKQLTDNFISLAMIVPIGAFGKMLGNIYLRVAKPGIPAQLFADEDEAIRWTSKFLS